MFLQVLDSFGANWKSQVWLHFGAFFHHWKHSGFWSFQHLRGIWWLGCEFGISATAPPLQDREDSTSFPHTQILQWTQIDVGLCGRLSDECLLVPHHADICDVRLRLVAPARGGAIFAGKNCRWEWRLPDWIANILQFCRCHGSDFVPILYFWSRLEWTLQGFATYWLGIADFLSSLYCFCTWVVFPIRCMYFDIIIFIVLCVW